MNKTFRITVVADTHVPDRRAKLPGDFLPVLADTHPDLILHAGDIIVPGVIRALETIAPVIPIRGNRDFLFFNHVPLRKEIHIHGKTIVLVHGHASMIGYLMNKIRIFRWDFNMRWFLPRLLAAGRDADVIIFGHTHRTMNEVVEGKLLFNPGSVNVPIRKGGELSFGILDIEEDGQIQGEVKLFRETNSAATG